MAITKTVRVGPFMGMNNRRPEYELAVFGPRGKTGDYLANAVNVDVTDTGTVQRRQGVEKVVAGADAHSLWAEKGVTLYADGTTLYRLGEDLAPTAIKTDIAPGLRCSYAWVGQDIYWSNGAVLERIANGVAGAAGVPVPNPAPVVEVLTGGSLPAGRYQVAVTAVRADGEESGATWPVQVEVPENGGLRISGFAAGGFLANVYLSPPNGDQLFRVATVPQNVGSVTYPVIPALGPRCQTLGLRQMPPGHIVRHFNGRLLVANGSTLFYSEPFAPALHNPARGYIPFPERITVCEPCESGVYVVADQTYWFAGPDLERAEAIPVLPYGAIEGTGGRTHTDKNVWWFSTRGAVLGTPGGEAKNLQEDNVAVGPAAAGASLYREHDGMRQLVSSLFGTGPATAAVKTWMEAELGRKENML